MSKARNLFTDYNGTLEPRYLEIPLAYELLAYHKEQGNFFRYMDLLIPQQAKCVLGFIGGDNHKLLRTYVTGVLKGEDNFVIEKATERLQLRETKVPSLMKKLLGEERIFGRPDPRAIELFKKAKENGMATGIYTAALLEFAIPALKEEGLLGYFDHIEGNGILYKDSKVDGFKENVAPGKRGLSSYISGLGFDPYETAFIDNEDIEPLTQVGMGIAAPSARQRFKDECSERGIYTPGSWKEIAEMLGFRGD